MTSKIEKVLSKKNYKAPDVFRFLFAASPGLTSLGIVLTVAHAFMPTMLMALATANFIDTATAILQGKRLHSDIYLPLILLLLVLGAYITTDSVNKLISARINVLIQRKWKPAIAKKHASLDFQHIENADSWELISRVSRDPIKAIMEGYGAFLSFTYIIVAVTAVLLLIVAQVWWAALLIFAFSAPMLWLSLRAGKKNYQASRDAEKFNRRTEYLQEVLIGRDSTDERTLFGYSEEIGGRWQEQYEAGRLLAMKVTIKNFLIVKGSSLILSLIAILIALTLIRPVIAGQISPGMFMGIVSAVFSMISQLGWQLSWSLENISRTGEFMKDLGAFLALSEAEDALALPDREPPAVREVEFRNVRFKYPTGDSYVLDGLSFTLEAGKHYAFVGKNGAGKTTITKLLTGLYTGYDGEILIDKKELRDYPAGTLKAMFSVVYQDFAKYYIPLSDNIILGDTAQHDKSGASSRQAAGQLAGQAAKQAGLGDLINELSNGMDTPLGKILEGGQDISGGEWQRVAIARSLLSRAPVKMLDEPTAALDPISESRIYEEFEKLMEGKTTVFISHRLGSTKLADEILVIDDGRIIERGTHDALLLKNGQYAEMFASQRGWYV